MGRFYQCLRSDTERVNDEEGQDFPDAAAARAAAIGAARELMAAGLRAGTLDLRSEIEIYDENGRSIAIVPFLEAVQIIR